METSKSLLEHEIREQPQTLHRLLDDESVNIAKVAAAIRARAPRFVIIAARGSSDNAARYGQYLFGAHNRLPVALATPSLYTVYKSPPDLRDSLVLAVSQSGRSPDILAVIQEGRRQGALTVAITNDMLSPLAGFAEHRINLRAGLERSIAATKTYTASLLALAMLSVALSGDEEHRRALEHVPALVSQTLEQAEPVISAAAGYRGAEACVVIGRGYNYATAFETALKLKELTYVLAEPYSSADFQHGPVALVENGFLVLAIAPEGGTAAELTAFLRELQPRLPRLVVISPLQATLDLASTAIAMPSGIPEWLSPLIAILPGQLFALGLAIAKGIDPDQPRGLQKVTLTR
jgi:glucosamine--fructose-6-phosphate aminotransferase (isomerizing)